MAPGPRSRTSRFRYREVDLAQHLRAASLALAALEVAISVTAASAAMPPLREAVTANCAQSSMQPVNPAGGTLSGPSCGGFQAFFSYGPNNAPASAYNVVTSSINMPLSAALNGGLPAPPPGTTPLVYFEVAGLSANPNVTYSAPSADRSLISSYGIRRGAKFEIVGYEFAPTGSNAGFRVIYQSGSYTASASNVLYINSPLTGLTIPQLTRTYFALLSIPAPLLSVAASDNSNGGWTTDQPGAQYTLTVGNAGSGPTAGTITVTDALPSGLTLSATPSGLGWNCGAVPGATTLSCTSTTAVPNGTNASAITVPVSVGPTTRTGTDSITNTALAYGGGDPVHIGPSTAASGADSTTVHSGPTFGGYKGNVFAAHTSGDSFEYSENPAVDFPSPIVATSLTYTLAPSAPSTFGLVSGHIAEFVVRKTPGVTYTLTIAAGVRTTAGASSASPVTYTFTTPAIAAPATPVASGTGQPYRYGVLEHPFSTSMAGPTGPQQIAALAAAGVGFVRIDFCGSQSEAAANTFNFTTEDSIARQLAAVGITELPIIDQYCSPPWANGGSTNGTSVWSTPALFAQFAAGVAAHVATTFPQITRIEVFNEPNETGWWSAPAPYSDTTGIATAAYMAAAYRAIKSAAPNLTVVGPALSDGGGGPLDPRTFLKQMYAAGCRTGTCWDVLSVHNYAWMNPQYATLRYCGPVPNRFDVYKDLQGIATSNGEPVVPHVMLTEWGYSTAQVPQGFDPAVQAQYLSFGANLMLADPTVDGIVWVNLLTPAGALDFWSLTGLLTPDYAPLPGYTTLQNFAKF
jgi:hypothetical protein